MGKIRSTLAILMNPVPNQATPKSRFRRVHAIAKAIGGPGHLRRRCIVWLLRRTGWL